jgi:cytochrome P450
MGRAVLSQKYKFWKRLVPVGPSGGATFAEMQPLRFDPFSPAVDADPFELYRRLRDEAPCFWSDDAQMWILSRYADVFAALNNWKVFSSASGNMMTELPDRAGATLGTTDPPRHDRLRALISAAFMKRNVELMAGSIREITREALDDLAGRNRFDFIGDFSSKVTAKILFRMLGLPPGDDQLVRSKAVLMVQSDPVTRRKGPEHIAAYEWMLEFAGRAVAERRRQPGEDLLSQLVLAEIDGEKLADREVLLTSTTLIMAGIESLGGFAAMFAYNLAEFPEARRRVARDPMLLPQAIEESLRFNTSGQRFKRRLQQDLELHGQQMRAGDFVCVAYGSANRDERQFANPDVYDIDRKPRGHLGFGGGVHACLGASIARLSLAIVFEEFLGRFPDFARTGEPLDWVPSSTFRSPIRLPLARQ